MHRDRRGRLKPTLMNPKGQLVKTRTRTWRLTLSAVAAALITVSSLLVATPAQAAGSFSLNNGHFFVAPPVVYPGLIAPVSAGLGNNSNASAATVTITFGIVCNSPGRPVAESSAQTIVIPPDPSRPAGGSQLTRVAATVAVPTACTKPTGPIPLSQDGYFWVKMTQAGMPDQMKMVPIWVGKPFTAANFRENLVTLTKQNYPDYQAHHQLPQMYRATFEQAGLAIDDPRYGLWWCSKAGVPTNHSSQAANYNAKWEQFFATTASPSQDEILAYMKSLVGLYVYTC
mgnify:CR=1 FL=1|jgi:hypothetical protein